MNSKYWLIALLLLTGPLAFSKKVDPIPYPSGLKIISSDCNQIKLGWQDYGEETQEIAYLLYRADENNQNNYQQIAYLPANTTEYTDNFINLSSDKVYYYSIRAIFLSYTTEFSYPVSASFFCSSYSSEAPKNLKIVAKQCGKIQIGWDDYPAETKESGYIIYRSDSENGEYIQWATVGASTLSFSDFSSLVENKTYYYKVKGRFGTRESDLSTSVNTSFTCTSPQNLVVSSASCGQINLSWSDYLTGINETGFIIYRSESNTDNSYSSIGEVGANVLNYRDLGWSIGLVIGRRYYYKVVGKFNGLISSLSNMADATTNCPTLTGLVVTNTSCGSVSLKWDDFADGQNETSFEIRRADSEFGSYNFVGTVNSNVLTYTDINSNLNPNQNYYYNVIGKFGNTYTSYSSRNAVLATTTCVAPTGLQILATTTCGEIQLSWADYPTEISESGYQIFRSEEEQGNYSSIGSVSADVLQYSDKGNLQSGKNYFYKIKGKFNNSYSDYSDFAKGTFTCAGPTNLAVESTSCGQIKLSWNDYPASVTEGGFNIYRSDTESGNYYIVGRTYANVVNFTDNGNYSGFQVDKTYFYKVVGLFNNSATSFSLPVSAIFTCPVPTGLKITSTECGVIKLAWDDYPENLNENNYIVYRSTTENGSYSNLNSVYNNVLTYTDNNYGLVPNQNYYYKIKGRFNNTETDLSAPISASFTCPIPSGLTVTATSCGSISLAWTDFSTNITETAYIIYRSTSENDYYQSVGQVNSNTLSYIDISSNLILGQKYYYKIQARFNNTNTDLSASVSASFSCVSPTGLRIASTSCGKINLAWDDYASPLTETGYTIYRSTTESGSYQYVTEVNSNVKTFTDLPSSNQTYYYKIKGKFYSAETDFGNVASGSFTCAAPTNFRLTGTGCGKFSFAWDAYPANSGVTGYSISIGNSPTGSFNYLGGVDGNVNLANNLGQNYSGLIPSNTYYYKILARFSNTTIESSSIVSGSFTCPIPAELVVSSTSCGKISLAWSDYPSEIQETGYNIFKAINETGPYNYIGQVNANIYTYSDLNSYMEVGKTYFYKIKGRFNSTETDFSSMTSGSFTCEAPSGLVLSSTTCGRINLSWNDFPSNINENRYDIYRSNSENGTFSLLANVSANTLIYSDVSSNLQFGATYFYKISARFSQSDTPFSNVASGGFTCASPTNLVFATSSCGLIAIRWQDYPVDVYENGFEIYRSFTENGTYQSVGTTNANQTIFIDNTIGLTYGLTYYYKVKGKFNSSYTDFSNTASGSFTCASPTSLAVTQSKCGEISMTWADYPNTTGENGYEIWRSDTGENGVFSRIGTVNASIINYTDKSQLQNGLNYFYKIKGRFNNTTTDFSNASSGSFTCGIPSGLAIESTICGEIRLKWDDFPIGINETGYDIYRADTENGTYSNRGSVNANILNFTDRTTGLSPGKTYFYKIVGRFSSTSTDFSNVASGSFNCPIPSGLKVVNTSCGKINLSWNQYILNGNYATNYQVYRATSETGTYTNIGSTYNLTAIFTDNGTSQFAPNTNYYYKIVARIGNVDTDFSLPISGSFSCDAPTGLTLISSKCGEIKLAWNDYPAELQESGYQILRSDTGENGTYNYLTDVSANTLNYTDIGNNRALKPNVTYYYSVVGRFNYNNYIYSNSSTKVFASFSCDKPTGLEVVASSCGSVKLTWDNYPSTSEYLGYSIQRSTSENSGFAQVDYVGKNINSYEDRTYGLNPNVTYYYKIAGHFQRTYSELSDDVSASFTCTHVPTGLKVASSNCGEIKLEWDDFPVGVNETTFEIYRNTPNFLNDFQRIGVTQANILTFTDRGSYSALSPNFQYTYKIKGNFGYINTEFGNEVKTSFTCEAITGLEVTSTECGNINLKWNNFSPEILNQNGFEVHRSTSENGTFSRITSLPANTLTYTDNSLLSSGITYYYKVFGKILNTLVPESNKVYSSFNCEAPTNLSFVSSSCGEIKLAWTDYQSPIEETQYYIYRSEIENGNYTEVGIINANTLNFSDISYNLIDNKTYFYKIRGLINNGYSAYSNVISASFSCVAPKGLTVTSSCGVISLSWDDYPINLNEGGYQILRSDIGPNGPYNFTRTTNANTTYYVDQNVPDSTKTYYYKVAGRFINTYTQPSEAVGARFSCNRVPTGLKITNSQCGRIELAWDQIITQNPLYNSQNYAIYRASSQNGSYTFITNTSSNTYADFQNLSANFTYFYKIKLRQNEAYTNFSETVSTSFICEVPQNLELVNESCEKITIKWAPVIGAISYRIYRAEYETGIYNLVKTQASQPADNQYIDSVLGQGSKTYFYKIQAVFQNSINSVFSNIVKGSKTCQAVIGLKVVATNCGEIKLAWNDFPAGINETGYKIYRIFSDGIGLPYQILVDQVEANILSFTDKGLNFYNNTRTLDENTNYEYKVTGIFGQSESNESNIVKASFTCNSAIQLSLIENTCGQIKIAWSDLPNNISETGFDIYRKSASNPNYLKIGSVAANILSYTDTGSIGSQLIAGDQFTYKILAKIGAVNTSFSNEIKTSFTCNISPTLSLTSDECGNIQISWTPLPSSLNLTGYQIYRSDNGVNGNYRLITTLNSNNYSFYERGNFGLLMPNVAYYYKVAGINYNIIYDKSNALEVITKCNNVGPNLALGASNCASITLIWGNSTLQMPKYYAIYRASTNTGGQFVQINTIYTAENTFTDIAGNSNYLEVGLVYKYKIAEINNGTTSILSNTVTASFTCPIITNLTSQATSCNTVKLNWDAIQSTTGNYYIYRSENGINGNYISINNTTTNSYIDQFQSLNSQTIYYKIQFRFSNNTFSELSNPVLIQLSCGFTIKSPPASFRTTAQACTKITLNWADFPVGTTEESFEIHRSVDNINFALVASPAANSISFIDQNLSQNTKYYYKIRGRFSAGFSDFSSVITVSTQCAAVANFSSPSQSCNTITLAWTDLGAVNTEESYELYRSTDGQYFTQIAHIDANKTEYTDKNLGANNTYYYKIRGRFGAGFTPFSATLTLKTACKGPVNFIATPQNCTQILLTWADLGAINTEESYELYRSTSGEQDSYQFIAKIDANQTQYLDQSLQTNQQYFYLIRGRFGAGFSPFSEVTSAKTTPLTIVLKEKSAMSATLAWNICSSDRENWAIFMSEDGKKVTEIGRADALDETFKVDYLYSGQTYYFWVSPILNTGYGNLSNMLNVTIPPFPGPTHFVAKADSLGQIKFSWKDNSNSPDHEESWALMLQKPDSSWAEIQKIDANKIEYALDSLKSDTTYCFAIRARFSMGYSALSNIECIKTLADSTVDSTEFTHKNSRLKIVEAHEIETNNYQIYPNPTQDYLILNIDLTTNQTLSIEILNAIGQLVKSEKILVHSAENKHIINVDRLPNGNYFLKIEEPNSEKVIRFMKWK